MTTALRLMGDSLQVEDMSSSSERFLSLIAVGEPVVCKITCALIY